MVSDNTQPNSGKSWQRKLKRHIDRTTIVIVLLVVAISIAHYLLQSVHVILHNFLQRLYYVPIVLAAYRFETKGAIKTALLCGLLYLPHILITWKGHYAYQVNQFLEIILFVGVGYLAGILFEQKKNTAEMLQRNQKMAQFGQLSRTVIRSLKGPIKSIRGMLVVLEESREGDGAIHSAVEIVKKQIGIIEQVREDLIALVSRRNLRLKRQELNLVAMKFSEQIEYQLQSRQIILSRELSTSRLEAILNLESIIDSLHSLVTWMLFNRRNINKIIIYTGTSHSQVWMGITVDEIALPTVYQGKLNNFSDHQESQAEMLQVINVMNNHFGDVRFRLKEGKLLEFILVFPKKIKLPWHLNDSPPNQISI